MTLSLSLYNDVMITLKGHNLYLEVMVVVVVVVVGGCGVRSYINWGVVSGLGEV
jgi:hypothetical protein